jgi:protein O-mannosyl-transferase
MTPRERGSGLGWIAAAVAATGTAVYANSMANGFTLDDFWIIQTNPRIHALGNWRAIWAAPYWPTPEGPALGLYRPLTQFAFAVQWALGHGHPWIYHAVNVALHGVVCGLVVLLLAELVPSRLAAAFGGLLFAVHPVHVEAVANGVGQAELLGAVGVLAACVLHVRRPRLAVDYPRLAGLLSLYALSLLAKENAVVLPALLVALDAAQGRIRLSPRGLLEYAGAMAFTLLMLGAVAGFYLVLRLSVLGTITGTHATIGLTYLQHPASRIMTALRAWIEYARLLFFPLRLAPDYGPALILPVTAPTPLMVLGALLLAVTLCLAALTPRHPAAGLPAAWFLITILPVSNLLFGVGVVVAERTLYLPSVAVAVLGAYLAHGALQRLHTGPSRRLHATALAAAGLVMVLLLATRTVIRNPVWRDDSSLMRSMVADTPENYRAQWAAAAVALAQGDTTSSLGHWRLAFRLWPDDPQLDTDFGEVLLRMGKADEAIVLLQRAARLHIWPARPERLLAIAYLQVGRYTDAIVAATRAQTLMGPTHELRQIRARALLGLGDFRGAQRQLRSLLARDTAARAADWAVLARALAAGADTAAAVTALDSAAACAVTHSDSSLIDVARKGLGVPPHPASRR